MIEENAQRLPDEVAPRSYRIDIDTDLDAATFGGTVHITAEVLRPTRHIVCNSAGLDVTSVVVRRAGAITAATHRLDAESERLVLECEAQLEPGAVDVEIAFSGTLNDQLVGFYTSHFNVDGEAKVMAVTQFEAPYARRAFPCWDEPDFKATFEIGLTCPAGLTAVSNGPEVARTDLGDGRVRFDFAPTMVMSTYLVAWVIGDLETSRTVRGGSTDIRVLHRPGQGHLVEFALDCAAHAVAWFEEYYGIDYPGDKLDLVAVPDFAFGAMENLGCVTFRENLLLIDPARANRSEQERAATVIEHEIAHMWFGDLVTMEWWNGIWLNEAFATFMEFCCADSFRPDWEIWTSFGLSKSAAFDTDALGNTRPIEFEVRTPADAEAMFDILTYEKGASVLRMFERWAGPDAFRDGVRQYLTEHAYANTDTPDLWRALSDATGIDVGALMNTWILQGGHPVLSVRADGDTVVIRQERFGFVGGDDVGASSWTIPLLLEGMVGGRPFQRSELMDGDTLTVRFDAPIDWITLNAGFTGFYRSEYDAPLRDALLALAPRLSSLDRYALVDDAWALFLAGRLTLAEVVTTLRAVAAAEDEASVWRRIAGVLGGLSTVSAPEARPALAAFTLELIGDRLQPAGGDHGDATDADRDLRAVLFRLAGTIGNAEWVIDEARARFAEAGTSAAPPLDGQPADGATGQADPDLRAAVLDVVANHGTRADFDRVLELFRTATTPQDELRALGALAQFPDPEMTAIVCEMCATEVRTQNAPYALAQAMGNRDCGEQVWRFVAERWDELVARFPSSSIIRMAGGIRSFADPDLVTEIEAFFSAHPIPQAVLTLNQHLERLRVNAATRLRAGGEAAGGVLTPSR